MSCNSDLFTIILNSVFCISFVYITSGSLIFIFSIIWTLGRDYLDHLLKSQRVQIIEV